MTTPLQQSDVDELALRVQTISKWMDVYRRLLKSGDEDKANKLMQDITDILQPKETWAAAYDLWNQIHNEMPDVDWKKFEQSLYSHKPKNSFNGLGVIPFIAIGVIILVSAVAAKIFVPDVILALKTSAKDAVKTMNERNKGLLSAVLGDWQTPATILGLGYLAVKFLPGILSGKKEK